MALDGALLRHWRIYVKACAMMRRGQLSASAHPEYHSRHPAKSADVWDAVAKGN